MEKLRMSSMFGQEPWALLTRNAYNYSIREFADRKVGFFFAQVENDLGRYNVAPAFGDYIALGEDPLGVIDRFMLANPELPAKFKFTADIALDKSAASITEDGFIHTIKFDSYEQWLVDRVHKDFRRMVKQARRRGVNITKHSDLESVREFWRMHVDLRVQKFAEIPQPETFFFELFEQFLEKGQGAIYFARDESGAAIGGVLVIMDGSKAFYKFNASRYEFLKLRPNNLLIDFIVSDLSKKGFVSLDLGFTGVSPEYSGLRKFKENAGGLSVPRYTWKSANFHKLDIAVLTDTNAKVTKLLEAQPTYEELNMFAEIHYKKFI
jgi:hypothetical protein